LNAGVGGNVMNPCLKAKELVAGLFLNSAIPGAESSFGFIDRNIGHHDKVPVLAQHAESGALFDRECFTQARHSCLEPAPFSWEGTGRRTVSLWRSRVPKPTGIW